MKKSVSLSFCLAASFMLMFASCQSEKEPQVQTDTVILPLDFSADGGKTLDGYWDSYFATGDTYYLDQIAAYTEADDELLACLNKAYAENLIDDSMVLFLGLDSENGVLSSHYDMDLLTVYFIRYGDDDIAEYMRYLYSLFPGELLVRNSVKSAAYWSLASNAEQNDDVNAYLCRKIPELPSKVRNTFSDIFDVTYAAQCVKVIENSSRWDDSGHGTATSYLLYEDGTWVKLWHEKGVSSAGNEYSVYVTEAMGTFRGNLAEDSAIELTVTHERYWQQMEREVEDAVENGMERITDAEMSIIPELTAVRLELIENKR